MLGIGVDIISINRIKGTVENAGKVFLDKVFTKSEQQTLERRQGSMTYLAMVFAAKEAIVKSFATGPENNMNWTDIEIKYGEHGEPTAVLKGAFGEMASQRGVSKVLLSLSNDGDFAIAMATII